MLSLGRGKMDTVETMKHFGSRKGKAGKKPTMDDGGKL